MNWQWKDEMVKDGTNHPIRLLVGPTLLPQTHTWPLLKESLSVQKQNCSKTIGIGTWKATAYTTQRERKHSLSPLSLSLLKAAESKLRARLRAKIRWNSILAIQFEEFPTFFMCCSSISMSCVIYRCVICSVQKSYQVFFFACLVTCADHVFGYELCSVLAVLLMLDHRVLSFTDCRILI